MVNLVDTRVSELKTCRTMCATPEDDPNFHHADSPEIQRMVGQKIRINRPNRPHQVTGILTRSIPPGHKSWLVEFDWIYPTLTPVENQTPGSWSTFTGTFTRFTLPRVSISDIKPVVNSDYSFEITLGA